MKRKSFEPDGPGRHRTAKQKAQILRAHRRSGLSLLAFARRHQLCYASLLRWRSGQSAAATEAGTPLDSQADPRFVPVTIQGDGLAGRTLLKNPPAIPAPRAHDKFWPVRDLGQNGAAEGGLRLIFRLKKIVYVQSRPGQSLAVPRAHRYLLPAHSEMQREPQWTTR